MKKCLRALDSKKRKNEMQTFIGGIERKSLQEYKTAGFKMRLIYFSPDEEKKAAELLKEKDRFSKIIISTEHGKYKKGEYVKSTGGQRLLVIDSKIITDFNHFKQEYMHHPELKNTNLDEIRRAFTHKKVEIIELKKYR